MLRPPHRRPEYRRAFRAGDVARWSTMRFSLLTSRSAPPRNTKTRGPSCAGRDRGHRTGEHMGATHAMREHSRAGSWVRRRPHPGARRWQLRATAFTFLVMVPLVAQGLVWSPALAATCQIPAAVASSRDRLPATPGAPTPMSAAGSSIIQVEGEAEPAATAAASPVATPVQPAPDPVELLGEELTAVAESLAACLTAGDTETVTQLAAERYLGQLFGSSVPFSRDQYVAIASKLTPIPTRIVSLEDATPIGDDRATALVTQVVGNQLLRAEWTFEPAPRGERRAGESIWRLAGER